MVFVLNISRYGNNLAKVKLGTTLAGSLWMSAMTQNLGDDPRFARGKTYFNKGYVKRISFNEGLVEAFIVGGWDNYDTDFNFYENDVAKNKIINFFHQNPLEQSLLLNGELSQTFFDWCKAEGVELFINKKALIKGIRYHAEINYETTCECYDFYSPSAPCKHILALLFAICAEIDNNPLVLLQLHDIELSDIVSSDEVSDDVAYPIDIVYKDNFSPSSLFEDVIEIVHQENMTSFILSLMPSNPSFATVDYKVVMGEFYKANKQALPQILTPIYHENIEKIERLFKEAKIEVITDKNLRISKAIIKHKVFRQEDTIVEILTPYVRERNTLGCTIDLINFTKLFLSFSNENGNYYYKYYYQLTRTGYLALNANAIIPAVITEKEKHRLFITWIPLQTKSFMRQLDSLLKNAISSLRHIQRGPYFDERSGSLVFLSALFNEYIKTLNFMHKKSINNPPEISKAFFRSEAFIQKAAGKQNIDKAIANTFSIFMLSNSKYKLNVTLSLDEQNKQYMLSLDVNDKATDSIVPFYKALKDDSTKELLKLIAPIRTALPEIEQLFMKNNLLLQKEAFESFILERASLLSALGVDIILPKELHNLIKPRVALAAKAKKSPNSFLDLQKILEYDWVIAIGEHNLSLEEFSALVQEQGQIINYKESYITLTPEELKLLLASAKKKIDINSFDIIREKFAGNLFLDKSLDAFLNELFTPKQIVIPSTLQASLREYQTRGIEWALSNLLNNFGVILADDMGLGKTIQTIAILLYLYENKHAKKQSIVVVPTSLLNNWQNELTKFAPSLDFSLYYGQARSLQETKIIITTYDTLKRDEMLQKHTFDIIVIDEAQKIKNPDTQVATCIKAMKSKYKIALSGTPVENSLTELWSIFDFTLRGYLGELNSFITRYVKPIEIEKDLAVASILKAITAPFMLRRLKTDKSIIDDLPDKIVIDEYTSMTPKQAALYQGIVDSTMSKLDNLEPQERFGLIFKLITQLKQVCNHPRNYDKQSDFDASLSGKTQMLLELLEIMIAKSEKVLIFTQYVEMAKILSTIIEKVMLIESLMLDGSMGKNARQKAVDTFEQSKEHPIFILSLKAGGVGLNLKAASNVIHYDLWFNPAVENQATDRAFRIGQDKNVFVYRFITKNSFEEKIDNMIKAKLAIGEMSISVGEKNISQMSNDEIKSLFLY